MAPAGHAFCQESGRLLQIWQLPTTTRYPGTGLCWKLLHVASLAFSTAFSKNLTRMHHACACHDMTSLLAAGGAPETTGAMEAC